MKLHTCQNCWFNALQYGALGLTVGYCSRHKKILNASDFTTCGLHRRKDLTLKRSDEVSKVHQGMYSSECIIRIIDNEQHENDFSDNEKDIELLRKDEVADVASDFGALGSTIESLSQLKAMKGARAELAMLSLSRGYVSNCISRNGKWTSGLHLYWWSRKRLDSIPEIKVEDLRSVGATQLARQSMLTAWSLMMLRLTFIEDITEYAEQQEDALGEVIGLTEQAACALDTFNLNNLAKWIKREAIPQLDDRLPYSRYQELASDLHVERAEYEAQQYHPADDHSATLHDRG